MLRAVRDGLAIAGTLAGLSGLGILGWAPVSYAYPALSLVVAAVVLLAVAAVAAWRAWRLSVPQPPVMATRPARFHIDNAPTVYVNNRWPR